MNTAGIKNARVVRGWRRFAVLGTAVATVSLGLLAAPAQADPATNPPPGADAATGWYLALGDSLAAGFQPGLGDDKTGGYVGHVLDAIHESAPRTRLTNLGCSGETTTTLVSGGICAYEEGTQLAQALEFLEAHTYTTRLVTLTVGANDVKSCLTTADVTGCVASRLTTIGQNLHVTLSQIRAAAPTATIIVSNYYNPYLASWFQSPAMAAQTQQLQGALNRVIESITVATGGVTADVATAFASTDTTTVATPFGEVPRNVAVICATTYMCTPLNNIHPNNTGYALIATAVVARLS